MLAEFWRFGRSSITATLGGASHPLSMESVVSDSLGQRKTHILGPLASVMILGPVTPPMEPCTCLKDRLRYKASDSALNLQVRLPYAFRSIPHLDPALQARLSSALQRPDLKPQTRAKIEKILKPNESHQYSAGRHHPT